MPAAPHVVDQPRWILVVRILQIIIAICVLGMSAYGIYWVAFPAFCLALFTSLATFIIVLYSSLSERVGSMNVAYNYWAVLALNIFAIIFWLASMADLAATRTSFKYPTTINGCVNYGYGGICYKKRHLESRAVATYGYLDMMSACAGLSALNMLLFVLALAVLAISLKKHRAAGGPNTAASIEKGQSHAMTNVSYAPVQEAPQQQQYMQQQPVQQQYQGAPIQSSYPQPIPSPAPHPVQQFQQYPNPPIQAQYQPPPLPSPVSQHAQPAQTMQTGYQAPPQGYLEVSAEHRN
ncbi:hypothetical protein AOQ84DRAFT_439342 [Glonium stellatum]|uniref:MARVEL domain-containing protein n=1 Tax=Glonium stellatum TaxID=574774 RepID=A0A8E2F1F6_9PEZI|nr:hypothetical protein AOQ84DRAFT_439342 [Glonium stellatum]